MGLEVGGFALRRIEGYNASIGGRLFLDCSNRSIVSTFLWIYLRY